MGFKNMQEKLERSVDNNKSTANLTVQMVDNLKDTKFTDFVPLDRNYYLT
jgi:hypothetical protein